MKNVPLLLLLLAASAGVSAQTPIERVKLTDNDLTCQQVYGEITQMDAVIGRANQPVAAAPVADPSAGQGAAVAGAVAGAVAQQAMVNAAARSGFGFGGFGGGAGAIGGLFGGLAQQAVAQQAAGQQAAAAAGAQLAAQQGQQAQGRKDHLTGLFLSKGCKMSDIQKQG